MAGYKRFRNGAWRLSVYVGVEPGTGRQRYVYRTVHEPDTPAGARAADRKLAAFVAEVDANHHLASDHLTLAELLTRWQHTRAASWSPKTATERRRLVDNHLVPALGDRRIDRLRPIDLAQYLDAKLADGMAPSTVAAHAAALRAALNLAVRWDLIARNPMDRVDPVEVPRRHLDLPPVETVARMLHELEDEDLTMAAYIRVAALAGSRRGEVCVLRWGDVDLDVGEVRISRALSIGDDGVVSKGTKTGRARAVALDRRTVEVIDRHRAQVREVHLAMGLGRLGDGDWVFGSPYDLRRPVRPESMSRSWRRIRARYGLDEIRLHDLRHFMATRMIESGEDVITVAGRVGHARTSTTTDIYGHRSAARDREAAQRFADLVDGAG
ncbi:MAG: site-specific integrase [Microthrixaceae bacterium]|nr:site-specific integrase [Microthrixaceae bacterium]